MSLFNKPQNSASPSGMGTAPVVPVQVPVPVTSVQPQPVQQPMNQTPAPNYMPMTSSNTVSGVIGSRMTITGDITFEGELRVQGIVNGNIRSASESKSMLIIDEKAEVNGEVEVPVVKVGGTIKGPVSSSELLHVVASGVIDGSAKYNMLQLDGGGLVTGSLDPAFRNGRK